MNLKHLAWYLPYEIKFQSSMDKPFEDFGKNPIWTLDGVSKVFDNYCLITKENNDPYKIESCKLMLLPLSKLNYEIALSFYDTNFSKFQTFKHYLELELLRGNKSNTNLEDFSYSDIQFFLEEHFDVFGLIEKRLAIDKKEIGL